MSVGFQVNLKNTWSYVPKVAFLHPQAFIYLLKMPSSSPSFCHSSCSNFNAVLAKIKWCFGIMSFFAPFLMLILILSLPMPKINYLFALCKVIFFIAILSDVLLCEVPKYSQQASHSGYCHRYKTFEGLKRTSQKLTDKNTKTSQFKFYLNSHLR